MSMRGDQVFKSLVLVDTEISSVKNPISVFLVKVHSVLLKGFFKNHKIVSFASFYLDSGLEETGFPNTETQKRTNAV